MKEFVVRISERIHKILHVTGIYHVHDGMQVVLTEHQARCVALIKRGNKVYIGGLKRLNELYETDGYNKL